MANICSNEIKIICSSAEYNEMKSAFEDNRFDWPGTYEGYEFSNYYQEMSFSTPWAPLPINQGAIDRLSKFYPSAIFKYFVNPEGDRKFTNWYCGGENYPESGIEKQSKMMYAQEVKRFLESNVKKAKGIDHEVALMGNGKVAADGLNIFGECNVLAWNGIVQVSCGNWHTVGLTQDGRVIACGSNANQQCAVEGFSTVSAISCGRYHTAVLYQDGTVHVASMDRRISTEKWTGVIKLFSVYDTVIGLRRDNTVLITGDVCPFDVNGIKAELGYDIILPKNFIWKEEADRIQQERQRAEEQRALQKKFNKAEIFVDQKDLKLDVELVNGVAFPENAKEQKTFRYAGISEEILISFKPKAAINRIEKTYSDIRHINTYNIAEIAQYHHEHGGVYPPNSDRTVIDKDLSAQLYYNFLKVCLLHTQPQCAKSVFELAQKTKAGSLHKGRVRRIAALPITAGDSFYELVAVNESTNQILIEIRVTDCSGRNYEQVKDLPSNEQILISVGIDSARDNISANQQVSDPIEEPLNIIFDYTCNQKTKTAVIRKYRGHRTSVIIPNEIDGCQVTSINPKLFKNSKVETVELSKNLISLEESTFEDCNELKC